MSDFAAVWEHMIEAFLKILYIHGIYLLIDCAHRVVSSIYGMGGTTYFGGSL